jgi:hypothetical protein
MLGSRRLLQLGALALLVALAVGLALALVHRPAAGHVDLAGRSFSIRSQLVPQEPQFGDTVVASIDVSVDPTRFDPDSIRVKTDFAPYEVASRSRTVRTVGGVSSVHIERRLRCLTLRCVPHGAVRTFLFTPAVISYRQGTAHADLVRGWPTLRVRSRITAADIAAPVLRVPPPVAAPVQYRLPSGATGYALLVLAGLLAAGGAALLLWVGLRRIAPPLRRVPPLERVLARLAASCSNGDSGRRRRALEELARELEPLDEPLSIESRVLAWGPADPKPEAVSDLTSRVRTAVRR